MNLENKEVKVEKKRSKKCFIAMFLCFEIVFTVISAPILIFYGPFDNLKKTVVGTAMATYKHKYLATMFLSQENIDEILNKNQKGTENVVKEQNIDDIDIKETTSSGIQLEKIQGNRFNGYMLIVKNSLKVKVGHSSKLRVQGEKTTEIAASLKALAAINAGGFEGGINTGTGAVPSGLLMSKGKVEFKPEWLEDDEKSPSIMGITEKGVLVVGSYSLNELKAKGVTDAVAFGPVLVVDGEPQIKDDGSQGCNPRTAIGQRKNGEMLLLVIESKSSAIREGASIKEVQNIMMQYGAHNAVNLDGGASTAMYYKDELVNEPSNPLGERTTASIVYVEP